MRNIPKPSIRNEDRNDYNNITVLVLFVIILYIYMVRSEIDLNMSFVQEILCC